MLTVSLQPPLLISFLSPSLPDCSGWPLGKRVQRRRGIWPRLCALQRKVRLMCGCITPWFLSTKRGLFMQETLKGEGNVMIIRDLLLLKGLDTHLRYCWFDILYLPYAFISMACQRRVQMTEFISRSHCTGLSCSSPGKGPVTKSGSSPGSNITKTWHHCQQGFCLRDCFYLQFFLQCITRGPGLPLISQSNTFDLPSAKSS